MSIDGWVKKLLTAFGIANRKDIKILKTIDFPHSMGSFYETVTEYLGYTPDSDEWKVMGMAAYGNKKKFKEFDLLIKSKSEFNYELNLNYFNHYNFDSQNRFSLKFENYFRKLNQ